MSILELVTLIEKLMPIVNSLYEGIQQAIKDSKELSSEDKEKLIKRIEEAQKKVVSWDEL